MLYLSHTISLSLPFSLSPSPSPSPSLPSTPLLLSFLTSSTPPHLEERRDARLRPAVLVGVVLKQESGYIGMSLPAGHEEGTLAVVVRCLHISTGLQEELGHTHMPLPN